MLSGMQAPLFPPSPCLTFVSHWALASVREERLFFYPLKFSDWGL